MPSQARQSKEAAVPSFILVVTALLLAAAPLPKAVQEKERGDRLAANGDLVAAAEAYQNAEKLSPGYAEAINQFGFLMARQNRLDEAVAHFQRAIEAEPQFALAHFNHGFVLRKLGRHAEAVEAFKGYVVLAPEDAAGYFNLAESHKGIGDSANAIAAYERYLAVEKDAGKQVRIEKARSAVEQLRRELGASVKAAKSVAPAAPASGAAESPTAVTDLVGASEPGVGASAGAGVQGSTDSAAAPAAAPAAAAPGVVVTAERAAFAQQKVAEALQLRAAGKKRESLFALQDAANADAGNAQAVFELGVAYAANYYFPQAVERWQRVLGMNVDEATKAGARENIEKARRLMGGTANPSPAAGQPNGQHSAQAVAGATAQPVTQPGPAAQPASSSQPASGPAELTPEAHEAYLLGSDLYGRQLYAEAIRQFDAAIASMPEFPQAYAARGSAWFAQREFNRALADYSQAMRLDSTLASPVLGVAETLNALGRKADAIPYYQSYVASRAADIQPSLQEIARQRLAEIGQ